MAPKNELRMVIIFNFLAYLVYILMFFCWQVATVYVASMSSVLMSWWSLETPSFWVEQLIRGVVIGVF